MFCCPLFSTISPGARYAKTVSPCGVRGAFCGSLIIPDFRRLIEPPAANSSIRSVTSFRENLTVLSVTVPPSANSETAIRTSPFRVRLFRSSFTTPPSANSCELITANCAAPAAAATPAKIRFAGGGAPVSAFVIASAVLIIASRTAIFFRSLAASFSIAARFTAASFSICFIFASFPCAAAIFPCVSVSSCANAASVSRCNRLF